MQVRTLISDANDSFPWIAMERELKRQFPFPLTLVGMISDFPKTFVATLSFFMVLTNWNGLPVFMRFGRKRMKMASSFRAFSMSPDLVAIPNLSSDFSKSKSPPAVLQHFVQM